MTSGSPWWISGPAAHRALVLLRWVQLGVEAAAAAVAVGWAVPDAPVGVLAATLAGIASSNVALGRARSEARADTWAGAAMLLDVAALTVLLAVTGGAANPFRAAYLVQVALAATVLRPAWTAGVVAAAVIGDGLLLLLPAAGHAAHMRGHLLGMWAALLLVGPFVAWSIVHLRIALARAAAALEEARERQRRANRLASLATLAAGAAHELASPLSTIAVASSELERRLGGGEPGRDAALIRAEVSRCRDILDQLATDVGAGMGAGVSGSVEEALEAATRGISSPERVRVDGDDAALDALLPASGGVVGRALKGLVDNALKATEGGPVRLTAELRGREVHLVVEDDGPGMAAEVLERALDPFFTTRPAGEGMGLGLFVASTLAEQLGGRLDLTSTPGRGTRVALVVPAGAAAGGREEAGPGGPPRREPCTSS